MSRTLTYDFEGTVTAGATILDIGAYITNIVASLDVDRTPFAAATITLENPPQAVRDALDPRRSTGSIIAFRVLQYNVELGGIVGYLPGTFIYSNSTAQQSMLYVQTYDEDALTDIVTVTATGAESRLIDKRRIAGTTVNTGAANLNALCVYSLNDTFGSGTYSLSDPLNAAGVSLPAGDRRLWQPGEAHWDLLESELNAAGGRLFADMAGGWAIAARSDPPRDAGAVSNLFASAIGIDRSLSVTSIKKTLSRADDWADGVLVKYSYLNGSGVQTVAYQASSGTVTRGIVVEYDRAPSASNLATAIAGRAIQRGSAYEVIGSIYFTARPGCTLSVIRSTGTISLGMVRAVEWDIAAGTMTLRSEIGQPT